MPSRATMRVALLRGILVAAALAITWPFALYLAYELSPSPWTVAWGAFLGAAAAPCAVLEAIGRRRGRPGSILLAALGAWALATLLALWFWPAVAFARGGGGADGLQAAGAHIARGELAARLLNAAAMGSLHGALTLVRAARAGVVAQALLTSSAFALGLTLGDWLHPPNQLFSTFTGLFGTAWTVGAPLALVAVAGACGADRIAWRSAEVPSPAGHDAVRWTVVALVLLVGPLALLERGPATRRRARIAIAHDLVHAGGFQRELALASLRDEAPDEARRVLVELGAAGGPLLAEHYSAFYDHWQELRPLLEHERPPARLSALKTLRRLAEPDSVEDLARALWDEDPTVCAAAAEALCDPLLEDYRERHGDRERYLAAVRSSDAVHVQARELLTHPDPSRRACALDVLERIAGSPRWLGDELARTRAALERMIVTEPDPALRERARAVSGGYPQVWLR